MAIAFPRKCFRNPHDNSSDCAGGCWRNWRATEDYITVLCGIRSARHQPFRCWDPGLWLGRRGSAKLSGAALHAAAIAVVGGRPFRAGRVVSVSSGGCVSVPIERDCRARAFITQSPAENVLSLQIFLMAISLPLMFLAAVIQERQDKEGALRESEQRYRTIVEGQTDLVCRFRPDTTLTFVNSTYARYFGKSADELIGQSFLTLIPERQREPARNHIESLLESQGTGSQEHEVLTPGGGDPLATLD